MNSFVIYIVTAGALFLGGIGQEDRPVRLGTPGQIIIPMGPEVIVGRGLDFDMDAGIGPAIARYNACLGKKDSHENPYLRAAQRAITKCKKAREIATLEADAALTHEPGWDLKSKRDAEINAALDNTDASYLKMARETDAYLERLKRK